MGVAGRGSQERDSLFVRKGRLQKVSKNTVPIAEGVESGHGDTKVPQDSVQRTS